LQVTHGTIVDAAYVDSLLASCVHYIECTHLASFKCFMAADSVFVHAEQKGRIVVEKILDGSNAALGGLQLGDVIRGTTGRSKVQTCAVSIYVCLELPTQIVAMSSA